MIHRLPGRPSNARIDPLLRGRILDTYKADDADDGPTLAAEKPTRRSC